MNLGFGGDQTQAGSALDRILSMAVPAYGLIRMAQGALDESKRPGTIFEYGSNALEGIGSAMDTAGGWMGGLLGDDTAGSTGLMGHTGYTDLGGYGYHTYDTGDGYSVGVESPWTSADEEDYASEIGVADFQELI